jgi:drug/metabolite transporter (DMT)-like permease
LADDGSVTRVISLSRSGIALCLLAGVAFAIQPVLLDRVLGDGSPFPLLAWRYLLAGLVLGAISWRGLRRMGWRTAAGAFALGAALFATDAGLFYCSITMLPVPLASLVHYAHLPIVVGAAVLVTGRRAGRRQIVAVALVVAGVALVSGGAGSIDLVGVVVAFASALAYALYMLLSARLLGDAEPLPAASLMLTGAGLSLLGLALAQGTALDVGGLVGVGAIVESGLVGSVVAVGAFYAGLRRVGPARTPILLAVDVPIGIALAAVVLGERLSAVQLLGALLVLTAIAALQVPTPRQHRARRRAARIRATAVEQPA